MLKLVSAPAQRMASQVKKLGSRSQSMHYDLLTYMFFYTFPIFLASKPSASALLGIEMENVATTVLNKNVYLRKYGRKRTAT